MSSKLEIPAEVLEIIKLALDTQDAIEVAIESGELGLSGVFERAEADPMVARLKLLSLLDAVPNCRKIDNRRLLDRLGIAESVKLFELDSENKNMLRGEFDEY